MKCTSKKRRPIRNVYIVRISYSSDVLVTGWLFLHLSVPQSHFHGHIPSVSITNRLEAKLLPNAYSFDKSAKKWTNFPVFRAIFPVFRPKQASQMLLFYALHLSPFQIHVFTRKDRRIHKNNDRKHHETTEKSISKCSRDGERTRAARAIFKFRFVLR